MRDSLDYLDVRLVQLHIDPRFVAERLGLTNGESRVAVALAEGNTVLDIAEETGRKISTVRWTVKNIYKKLNITRQVDLVRLVLLLPHDEAAKAKPDTRKRVRPKRQAKFGAEMTSEESAST